MATNGSDVQKGRSIILRTRPLREADLLVTFLSAEAGKMVGVAPHARKSRKRFGGALEPGTVGTLTYRERNGQELVGLEDMHVDQGPPSPTNMSRFAALGVVLNIVEQMSMERAPASEKYLLLRKTLDALMKLEASSVMFYFMVHWFRLSGFSPVMDQCVLCQQWLGNEMVVFAPGEGGAVCMDCGRSRGWTMRLSAVARHRWQVEARLDMPQNAFLDIDSRLLARDGMWQYLMHILDRGLSSAPYWGMIWD